MRERPTPYDLVFSDLGPARFPRIRQALEAGGHDAANRDAFVLMKEVVELLRELRPDEGVGEAIRELVAFLHAAFLFWRDGESVVELDRAALAGVVGDGPPPKAGAVAARTYYLQLPAQRVWGEPIPGQPPEPLDGVFVTPSAGGFDLVAIFGLHPGRVGFTAVSASGPPPGALARPDASPVFSPRLEGGRAAGLHSLAGTEELLALVAGCHGLLGPAGPAPGRQRLTSA